MSESQIQSAPGKQSDCDCEAWMRPACFGEVFAREYQGKRYCVLHHPGEKSAELFNEAINKKREEQNYQFQGVIFPDSADFGGHSFEQPVSFKGASFGGPVVFARANMVLEADFSETTFKAEADFREVFFAKAVNFSKARFEKDASLASIFFGEDADFAESVFLEKAVFNTSLFNQSADFTRARFDGQAEFRRAEFAASDNQSAIFIESVFATNADFGDARFFGDAKFFKAWFGGETSFRQVEFTGKADFVRSRFNDAEKKADFSAAPFYDLANFREALFLGPADFSKKEFNKNVNFSQVRFDGDVEFSERRFEANADFQETVFGKVVNFVNAFFAGEVKFEEATFKDYVRFAGEETKLFFGLVASLNLQFARCEKPERVSFHTLSLRPHWFVNVDPRKFEFIKVEWDSLADSSNRHLPGWRGRWRNWLTGKERLDLEWEALAQMPGNNRERHRLLSIACRQLAVNAEENHRYSEASIFRYESMEIRRWEHAYRNRQKQRFRHAVGQAIENSSWKYFLSPRDLFGLARKCWGVFRNWRWKAVWSLDWWYWLVSDFGESIGRGFVVFAFLLALFAASYTRADFERPGNSRLGWRREVVSSLAVSLLQRPEPKPAGTGAKALILLETALGPAQAALLALAVRRRFMR